MKLLHKIYIAGAAILLSGIINVVVALCINQFDLGKMNAAGPKTQKTYECLEDIENIEVLDKDTSVVIAGGNVNKVTFTYWENEKEYYTINDNNGSLCISKADTYTWFDRIFFFSVDRYDKKLEITVPEDFAGELSLKTSNAVMDVSKLNPKQIKVTNSNGKIVIEEVESTNDFDVHTSNGRIEMVSASASKMDIENSNSSIKLENVKITDELEVKDSNGEIEIQEVQANSFYFENSNARIEIKESECKDATVNTSNGKIILTKFAANNLDIDESNAGISFDEVTIADTLECENSNGRIEMKDTSFNEGELDDFNAAIRFDNVTVGQKLVCTNSNGIIEGSFVGKMSDYNINSDTSNAKCNLPDGTTGADKDLTFKTSNAAINIEFTQN